MKTLEMDGKFGKESIIIDVQPLVEVVVDIPEATVPLVARSIGKSDRETSLVGKFGPAVIVPHIVVVAAVPMQCKDEWGISLQVPRDMNPILTGEPIVFEVDVLRLRKGGGDN